MQNDVRLIDANALLEFLGVERHDAIEEKNHAKQIGNDYENHFWSGAMAQIRWIKTYVYEAPTIDAVPVVRCRECKYHRVRECPMRSLDVNPAGRLYVVDNTDDDGFCYKGAKMDGGANDE